VVKRMKAYEVRSYIPEKKQKGRRNWAGKQAEQQTVYANRRRVRASTARVYCGGAANWWSAASRTATRQARCGAAICRGQENILKWQLVHVGAFNLSLILRKLLGAGTPRKWKNRLGSLF